MDRAEALKVLKEWREVTTISTDLKALDLAIEALEGDLHCPKCGTIVRDGRQYHDLVYRGEAEPTRDEGDAESATTTDCISRADTLKALCAECDINSHCYYPDKEAYCTEYAVVKGMPPAATPTERTGEWIPKVGHKDEIYTMPLICSECGAEIITDHDNYCGHCGAKMGGDTE